MLPFLLCRLLQHVVKGVDFVCATGSLYDNYVRSCGEGDTTVVSEISSKRCVHDLFAISPTKTHSNNKTVTVYKGLKYVESCDVEAKIDVSIAMNELPMDWYWIERSDSRIAATKTGLSLEDKEIVKEVHLSDDGGIKIFLGTKPIDPTYIGLPSVLQECTLPMWDYLQLVRKCNVCMGKEVTPYTKGVVRIDNGQNKSYRKVATNCQRIMSVVTHSAICHRCYSQNVDSGDQYSPFDHTEESTLPGDNMDTEQFQTLHDITDDEAFTLLFPNASPNLSDLLYSQAKCSRAEATGSDARSRRLL